MKHDNARRNSLYDGLRSGQLPDYGVDAIPVHHEQPDFEPSEYDWPEADMPADPSRLASLPSSAGILQIPQGKLEELHRIKEQLRLLSDRHSQLRGEVLTMVEAGATTAPGPLILEVRRYEQRLLSIANLTPILGVAGVDRLRSQVQPVVRTNVIVRQATL